MINPGPSQCFMKWLMNYENTCPTSLFFLSCLVPGHFIRYFEMLSLFYIVSILFIAASNALFCASDLFCSSSRHILSDRMFLSGRIFCPTEFSPTYFSRHCNTNRVSMSELRLMLFWLLMSEIWMVKCWKLHRPMKNIRRFNMFS